jgi:hypothetical protein
MATRTLDVQAKLDLNVDGDKRPLANRKLAGQTVTHFLDGIRTLATSTTNDQLDFGDGFTTALYVYLESEQGTFTVSLSGNSKHQTVGALMPFLFCGSVTSVFLSNNSTGTDAKVKYALAG